MGEEWFLAADLLGAVLGGALGARFSRVAIWKGAVVAALASVAHGIVGAVVDIEHPVLSTLVYVGAVALIGGPLGLRMNALALSLVIIGSFLVSSLLLVILVGLTATPASG